MAGLCALWRAWYAITVNPCLLRDKTQDTPVGNQRRDAIFLVQSEWLTHITLGTTEHTKRRPTLAENVRKRGKDAAGGLGKVRQANDDNHLATHRWHTDCSRRKHKNCIEKFE